MNAKKGCFRIFLALSILSASAGFLRLITSVTNGQAEAGLLLMIGGPVVVGLMTLVTWWIVQGFTGSD